VRTRPHPFAAAATIDDFQRQVVNRLDELDSGLEDVIESRRSLTRAART
jgi:hypothetical protein